ncbi:carboxypeptidase regulatory-like domain-containing protein [Luteolibacter sp. GHJ8]|jgi:hypothetical protein|uniref:Carboxypeptidase regulatory-like domain-containing protein n=1 Tax=Luteolibacter rhizosphaerae TaxID=2989719 RepID=A0ABT3G4L3_9BACT|nr:carboxypeptidase regulatory-like domain-containing protein [Luteolibacter rhizosphaerae]MCW1914787.1 carboxypeptidase regulatory-like domain-containing protein [Luteolibacter rhizosphaerae]
MKAYKLGLLASLALAGSSLAGGIQGRILDDNGNPRSGVTVSVKGYRQTTTTDSNGYYTLQLPAQADGTRVNFYVKGTFAVNVLVPVGSANSTVDVTLVRR